MRFHQYLKCSLFSASLLVLIALISACDTTHYYAPVSEITFIEKIPKNGYHHALEGETLYEIAWRYGLDYRYLVWRNHIPVPYVIHAGQIIYLRDAAIKTKTKFDSLPKVPLNMEMVSEQQLPQKVSHFSEAQWSWPVTSRRIIQSFSASHKGINIAGFSGEPIRAAAAGKIVYAGNGLRGYGNLIIIKHNSQYLSAYAHHRMMQVKEGDWVIKGQKIAEMGDTGSDKVMLHFEVRRAGKPVDPLALLPH